MAENSKIEWTDATFNPWWGCAKVSPGCAHCYAESFAKRTGNDVWGLDAPRRFFGDKHWAEPLKWNKKTESEGVRRRVFVASMADVFETHRNVDTQGLMDGARHALGKLVQKTPALDWLFLTKRIESAQDYLENMFGPYASEGLLPDNLWIGTTCESQDQYQERAPHLLNIDAAVKFISVEPQLDLVEISRNQAGVSSIDWVICGGESGAKCRPFNPDWARSLRDECEEAGIAFFMKQLGGHPNKRDRLEDLPEDLRIREYPKAGQP